MGRAGWPAAVSWRWGNLAALVDALTARWLVFATGVAAGSLVSLLFGRATQQSCADAAAAAPRAQTSRSKRAADHNARAGEVAWRKGVCARGRVAVPRRCSGRAIVKEWALAAEYCLVHEPFLFTTDRALDRTPCAIWSMSATAARPTTSDHTSFRRHLPPGRSWKCRKVPAWRWSANPGTSSGLVCLSAVLGRAHRDLQTLCPKPN